MKYIIVLFVIFLPALATAQKNQNLDSLGRIKLYELVDSWTLGIQGNTDVDIKVYNKFKELFDSNATVVDGLSVFYQYNAVKKTGSYLLDAHPRAFDIYAHDVALQIKNITIDSVVLLDSGMTDQGNLSFTIRRRVDFQKAGKYIIPENYSSALIGSRAIEFGDKNDSLKMVANLNAAISRNQDSVYKFTFRESLRITMAVEMDAVKITNIAPVQNEITCTNDSDLDAVLDGEDSLPKIPGDFTADGRPDYDLDGVPDADDKCPVTYGPLKNKGCPPAYFYTKNEFDGFIGVQINTANIHLPELNQLGYVDAAGNNAMDVLQSKKGLLKNPANSLAGVYAGGNFIYYFGQKGKGTGISFGCTYSRFMVEYQLVDPIVYTFKSFDGANFYRRQITISSLKEGITYNVINFPIMLNYRFHIDKKEKSVIKIEVGPSAMFFKNTSSYSAVVDFGGLYQIDTVRKNAITYYDYFNPGSKYNVFLASDSINAHNLTPGANNVFEQLGSASYDFADNKSYNGKQNLQRITVGFNLNLSVQQKISEGLTIQMGAHFVYAPLFERMAKYKPIDKTSDAFQSIYKSNASSNYSSLGVNVGIVYNW